MGRMNAEECFRVALGRELRRIREAEGVSRQQLQNRTGISRNSIERYEGGADVPVMTFVRLCVALGRGCGEILDRALWAEQGNTEEPAPPRVN